MYRGIRERGVFKGYMKFISISYYYFRRGFMIFVMQFFGFRDLKVDFGERVKF